MDELLHFMLVSFTKQERRSLNIHSSKLGGGCLPSPPDCRQMDYLLHLVLPKCPPEERLIAKLTPNQHCSLLQQGVRLRVAFTSPDYTD
jgi:hypothetical protein